MRYLMRDVRPAAASVASAARPSTGILVDNPARLYAIAGSGA